RAHFNPDAVYRLSRRDANRRQHSNNAEIIGFNVDRILARWNLIESETAPPVCRHSPQCIQRITEAKRKHDASATDRLSVSGLHNNSVNAAARTYWCLRPGSAMDEDEDDQGEGCITAHGLLLRNQRRFYRHIARRHDDDLAGKFFELFQQGSL